MFLYLDTTTEKTVIALFDAEGKIIDQQKWISQKNQSSELLFRIDSLLKDNNFNKSKIKKIIVNAGPGSFTGLRVGLSTANAWAFSQNIPVIGLKNNSENSKLKAVLSHEDLFKESVLPFYGKPAKITKPKN